MNRYLKFLSLTILFSFTFIVFSATKVNSLFLEDVVKIVAGDKYKVKVSDDLIDVQLPSNYLLISSLDSLLKRLRVSYKIDSKIEKNTIYLFRKKEKKVKVAVSSLKQVKGKKAVPKPVKINRFYKMTLDDFEKLKKTLNEFKLLKNYKFVYATSSNILLVKAYSKDMSALDGMINLLGISSNIPKQIQKKQVRIKAYIVGIDRNALKDLGNSMNLEADFTGPEFETAWPLKKFNAARQTGDTTTTSSFTYGKFSLKNLTSTLKYLESKNLAVTYSMPSVTVLDGEKATLKVGKQYPYVKTSNMTDTGVAENVEYIDIGIILEVTPTVVNDIISMQLKLQVSELEGIGVNNSPIIGNRETQTVMNLKSNQVLVIGGLFKKSKYKTKEKVPFFSEIPIFGKLFRRNKTEEVNTDLYLFLTAQIIDGKYNEQKKLQKFNQKYLNKKGGF